MVLKEQKGELGFQREKQRDKKRGISMKYSAVCRYSEFPEDGRNQTDSDKTKHTARMLRYMEYQKYK